MGGCHETRKGERGKSEWRRLKRSDERITGHFGCVVLRVYRFHDCQQAAVAFSRVQQKKLCSQCEIGQGRMAASTGSLKSDD